MQNGFFLLFSVDNACVRVLGQQKNIIQMKITKKKPFNLLSMSTFFDG